MSNDVIIKKASSLLEQGLFDQAQDLLQSIPLPNANEVEVVYMMALTHANMGSLELANDHLARALALNENHEDSIYSKGRSY
jgi:hypothetical protein